MALPLQIDLQANLDKFQAGMTAAGDLAQKQVDKIEKAFQDANPHLNSSALTGAFAGIAGIAGIAGLQKMLDILVNANSQLASMADNAKLVGLSTDQFQSLRFAANVGGVSDEKFATDVTDLAKKLNEARTEENKLTELFDLNGKQWKDTNGQVIGVAAALKIIGDLVRNAQSELDKVRIVDLVGLSKEWIASIGQGGDAFQRIADSAKDAGVIIDRETIQKAQEFSKQWNAASTAWSAQLRANISDIIPLLDGLVSGALKVLGAISAAKNIVSDFAHVAAADIAGKDPLSGLDTRGLERLKSSFEDTLKNGGTGNLDKTNDKGEVVGDTTMENIANVNARIAELKRQQAEKPQELPAINVNGTKLPPSSSKSDTEAKDAFDHEVDRLKRTIALREADVAAVGKSENARESLRAELSLLQAAEKSSDDITTEQITTYAKLRATMSQQDALVASGIKLTDAQAEAFTKVTARATEAGASLQKAKNQFQGINDVAKLAGNQAVDVIDGLINKTMTWGEAVQSTARLIEKELLRAALTGEGAFAKLFGTNSNVPGGTGGLFGMIAKAFSGGFGGSSLTPNDVQGLGNYSGIDFGPQLGGVTPGFASGTDSAPGGLAMIGENGPELMNVPRGAQVIPNDVVRGMGGQAISIAPATSINITGSDITKAQVAQIVAQAQQKTTRDIMDALPGVSRRQSRLNL